MQFTQKEKDLLKDMKGQEQLCIDKYTRHAECAHDAQLKNLFSCIAQVERQHLDTLNSLEGNSSSQSSGSSISCPTTFTATYNSSETSEKKDDCFLCSDLLAIEKHASHLYDTCVFEFSDESVRNTINHIQKEEQNHGKMIYDYMKTNSMYS
ncbi:MAG: spore coat protein [Ruminococcaceae bacterium]|nr:spore coat protein [Oscillospiraceae bacterium]